MTVREILTCFQCRQGVGGPTEPHRDFPMTPFGVGWVHERCLTDEQRIKMAHYPVCTRTNEQHYPYRRITVSRVDNGAAYGVEETVLLMFPDQRIAFVGVEG